MATQLITPNPNITCTPGECLVYVQNTFGIGPKYPSAITAWNSSAYKHTDQNFPENVWVPIWFSLSDNPNGHVVIRQPDGSIWSASSPTSTTPVHHASLNALGSYYRHRLTYLGWTEDVEDTLILTDIQSIMQQPTNTSGIAVVADTWSLFGKHKGAIIQGSVVNVVDTSTLPTITGAGSVDGSNSGINNAFITSHGGTGGDGKTRP